MAASTDSGSSELTNRVDLLWDLEGRRAKRPRVALTLERIAKAATELADAEGVAAVSMQQVANKLGVTKMALYRHVANKAELIAVMTEMAIGPAPDLSTLAGGWRVRCTEWARQMSETWRTHPWLPEVTMGERATGPREIGWTEAAVAALAETGLTGTEKMDAVFLLSGHLRNTHAVSNAGTQPWTADRNVYDHVAAHPERFPALVAAMTSVGDAPTDNGWEFGLGRILDGLAIYIQGQRAS